MTLLPSSPSVFDLVLSFIAMLTTYQISRGQYFKWKCHVKAAASSVDKETQAKANFLLQKWNIRNIIWWHIYLFWKANAEEVEIHGLKYHPWKFPDKPFRTY